MTTSPPDGFEVLESGAATVWVRPEARAWVEEALERGETLSEAAGRASGAGVRPPRGSGPQATTPPRRSTGWIVRSYGPEAGRSRLGSLLGGRRRGRGVPTPFRALRVSEELLARRLTTPRGVAAAVYASRRGHGGDLLSERVPDALELAQILFDPERTGVAGSADRKEALREAGSLIRKLSEAGVHHRELTARTVLLRWYAAPDGHVLAPEHCEVASGPDPKAARAMHRQLLRSIRKLERKTGLRIPPNEREILAEAVQAGS